MNNVEILVYDKIFFNFIKEYVMEVVVICWEEKCDFVVGLGGGSFIDFVKSIVVMVCNDGDYWDYVLGGSGKGCFVIKVFFIIVIFIIVGIGIEMDLWIVIIYEMV